MKKRYQIIPITFIIFLILGISTASAAAPQLISVQGRLTDTSDSPVTSAAEFNFSIYNASTGGKMLWNETKTITPDSEGKFSTYLGSITPLALPFDKPYYLEVKIDGDLLDPRYSMTSVPYSLNAAGASGSNYCKRTSAISKGDLGGLSGADAKCEGEFGAGWHFAKTDEDLQKILSVHPAAYVEGNIDNWYIDDGWIHIPSSSQNCINLTDSKPWTLDWGAFAAGKILWPVNPTWALSQDNCAKQFPLWCCPP